MLSSLKQIALLDCVRLVNTVTLNVQGLLNRDFGLRVATQKRLIVINHVVILAFDRILFLSAFANALYFENAIGRYSMEWRDLISL